MKTICKAEVPKKGTNQIIVPMSAICGNDDLSNDLTTKRSERFYQRYVHQIQT